MDAALTGRLAQLDAAPVRPSEGRLAARRRSEALDAAIRRLAPPDLRKTAIAAIGGYGRSEMTPGSDVDLLIVYEPDAEDEAATVAEAVLYPLWDAGLPVGHSVRTLGECVFEIRRNLESLTALLSVRLLDGSELLVEMARKAALDHVRADRLGFFRALRAGRAERETRFGRLGRIQEPDLKESLGGLRDLQTAGWLSVALGVEPPPDQRSALEASLDLVLGLRTALHRVTGGRDNRLADAQQQAVAEELGLEPEPGWEVRDVLMRAVARAGRGTWATVDALLSGDGSAGAGVVPASPDDVERAALLAGLGSHGAWTSDALEGFVALLGDGYGESAIRTLDERGSLGDLLPGWSDLAGRPQHDPYHRYPVDVHLTEAAAAAARWLDKADDPIGAAAAAATTDRGALILGAFLHDAGKIGRGSHVEIGVAMAGRILDRMGIAAGERRDLVLFLVREHLLLSDTATRRNLDDEDLILHVAARVHDRERLGMLYLLTMADAHATGPSASTPWRVGLIRELVAKVDRAFDRGLMDPDRASEVERAESAIRAALVGAGTEPATIERFLDITPPAYALWVESSLAPAHLSLVLPVPAESEARVHVVPGRAAGTWAVTVGARDRLGLLATIAGAFAVSGISILTARAFTTADRVALDAFEVGGSFEDDVGEERWARFRALLAAALDGTVDMRTRMREWQAHYRAPAADVPVKVTVAEDVSDYFTLFEVQTADRLGLLFDLAGALSEAGVDVHVAQAATYGPRIVDVFYVTEQSGGRVQDPERLAAVRAALAAAAAAPAAFDDGRGDAIG
jgi:[protein-PII] uridylyltransferase